MKANNLLKDIEYHDTRPAIKVMLNTDFTKEIRILMRENHEMKEHKTPFPIVIQIIEGRIDFGVNGKRHDLSKGSIVALPGGVPHDLIAKEQSMIRLTLNKFDAEDRVSKVLDL
ncbi:AraC family ligand binding domain-containing protein [Membranicola marinus]|uniref:AraC family ligand binding domain-containing protein n=1 Tax=Membranihabitans marinus TaxID=1227546 RepID=A0A953L8E8_9BACT|nr:AraC family ligand binding domain-containing protein [Membranihabitans marinus]MBY5959742.1 AraC family ligand binding domain-containing protein [Membranihabitans marinus]